MKRAFLLAVIFFLLSWTNIYAVDFVISNPRVTGDEITFDAATSSCSGGRCYLQGGIKKDGGQFFGFTKNNLDEWVGYVSNTPASFIKNKFLYCDSEVECNISVSMRFNYDDKLYKGPGEYIIKLKRYTGESDSEAQSSNELLINLDVATPAPTASPTPSPTPSPTASPTPTPTATHKISASMGGSISSDTPKPTTTPSPVPTSTVLPTVLALSEESNHKDNASGNSVPTVAILFVASGLVIMAIAGVSIAQARYNKRT